MTNSKRNRSNYRKRNRSNYRKRKNSIKKRKETTRKELVRELKGFWRKHNATRKRKKKRRKKIGGGKDSAAAETKNGRDSSPPTTPPPPTPPTTPPLPLPPRSDSYMSDHSVLVPIPPHHFVREPIPPHHFADTRSYSDISNTDSFSSSLALESSRASTGEYDPPDDVISPVRVRSASSIDIDPPSDRWRLNPGEENRLKEMMRRYPYIGKDGVGRMFADVNTLKFLLIQKSHNFELYEMLIQKYPELLMSRSRADSNNNNVDDIILVNKYVRLYEYITTIQKKQDGIDDESEFKGPGLEGDLHPDAGTDIDDRTHGALYGGYLWDPHPPFEPFLGLFGFLKQSNDFMGRHLNIKEIIDHDNNRIILVKDGEMYSYPVEDILNHYSDIGLVRSEGEELGDDSGWLDESGARTGGGKHCNE